MCEIETKRILHLHKSVKFLDPHIHCTLVSGEKEEAAYGYC